MSTSENKKYKVDIIPPSVKKSVVSRRGPKHRDLPEDLIRQLASECMGSRDIATRLREYGVSVSYKTIQRVLAGARQPVHIC